MIEKKTVWVMFIIQNVGHVIGYF